MNPCQRLVDTYPASPVILYICANFNSYLKCVLVSILSLETLIAHKSSQENRGIPYALMSRNCVWSYSAENIFPGYLLTLSFYSSLSFQALDFLIGCVYLCTFTHLSLEHFSISLHWLFKMPPSPLEVISKNELLSALSWRKKKVRHIKFNWCTHSAC